MIYKLLLATFRLLATLILIFAIDIHLAVAQEIEPPVTNTPPSVITPTFATTITPALKPPTKEERDVENLNVSIPKNVKDKLRPQEVSIFGQIANLFASLLGFTPIYPEILSPRSKIQSQAEVPSQVIPSAKNEVEKINKNLNPVYTVESPKETQAGKETVKQYDSFYKQSHFPKGTY